MSASIPTTQETIDALTSGYAFCEQDARELVELVKIGRLRIKQENSRMSPDLWLEVNQQIRNAIGEYQTRRPNT